MRLHPMHCCKYCEGQKQLSEASDGCANDSKRRNEAEEQYVRRPRKIMRFSAPFGICKTGCSQNDHRSSTTKGVGCWFCDSRSHPTDPIGPFRIHCVDYLSGGPSRFMFTYVHICSPFNYAKWEHLTHRARKQSNNMLGLKYFKSCTHCMCLIYSNCTLTWIQPIT